MLYRFLPLFAFLPFSVLHNFCYFSSHPSCMQAIEFNSTYTNDFEPLHTSNVQGMRGNKRFTSGPKLCGSKKSLSGGGS